MAKGCPDRSEGKERLISPFAKPVAISPLLGHCRSILVWRMSNHERIATSGIRGGGAERPSWALSGMGGLGPEADCLLLGCSPAKQTLTLARRSAVSDPQRTWPA